MVARGAAAEQAEKIAGDIAAAFDLLPSAAVLATRDGSFCHINAAARALLATGQLTSLTALLGEPALAEDLLNRTEAAGTVVLTRTLPVRLGSRDIRLTLKRLNRR